MSSEDKGEWYVDPAVENHTYRTICCSHCGHELHVPVYCGSRFCPVCSRGRQFRVRQRLEYLVKNFPKENYARLRFLTLTIRSEADLSGMLPGLLRSFRRLRQRSFWRKRVMGGAFVIEITYGRLGWHAHIHAILYSKYLAFNRLLKLWMSVSTGRGVYIKEIPTSHAVGYLTKYLIKPAVPTDFSETLNDILKGYRLFQPIGNWINLLKDFHLEKRGCPRCGSHSWFPLLILYSKYSPANSLLNTS